MWETWVQSLGWEDAQEEGVAPHSNRASLVAQKIKNLPAVWEIWVESLGWEGPLEKGMATHSSILPEEFHGLCSSWGCKELDANHFHKTLQPNIKEKNLNT